MRLSVERGQWACEALESWSSASSRPSSRSRQQLSAFRRSGASKPSREKTASGEIESAVTRHMDTKESYFVLSTCRSLIGCRFWVFLGHYRFEDFPENSVSTSESPTCSCPSLSPPPVAGPAAVLLMHTVATCRRRCTPYSSARPRLPRFVTPLLPSLS